MIYRDYKGRRTEEIKENDICLLGDIVEGCEDSINILECESYYSYDCGMLVYFEIIEQNKKFVRYKNKNYKTISNERRITSLFLFL